MERATALLDVPPGERLVVSTDASVEYIHFRRDWLTPKEIGWRATTAALSDLAAMGATPLGVLTALAVPETWRDALSDIGEGIADAVAAVGTKIVGGDMSASNDLTIAVTVLGSVKAPLERRGARAGDSLWVTGTLGGPAAALRSWLAGDAPSTASRERFVHPRARIEEGKWLATNGATAAIDISDGLIADARHIAAASGVAITIALNTIPLFAGSTTADAAAGGEEYELLVAAPPSLDARAFTARFSLPLTRVGEIAAAPPTGVTVTMGGASVEFSGGYDHFVR